VGKGREWREGEGKEEYGMWDPQLVVGIEFEI
jgi:hypothetical protein